MKMEWLSGVPGAVVMALAWAVVWGPVAMLAALIVDPDGSMDEMWVGIGAYTGFLSAAILWVVLAIAERRRRLDELPLPRAAAGGALAGLLVGLIPFVLANPAPAPSRETLAAVVIPAVTLMSALSAVGWVLLLRTATRGGIPARAGLRG